MNLRPSILAYGLSAVLAAVGCGDDDGGGSVSTGLPAGDELSSLSDAETRQVCRRTTEAFNDILPLAELERIACHGVAVMSLLDETGSEASSSEIAMCKQIANQCISSDAVDPTDLQLMIDTDCENVTTASTFGDCDATVGDYERCAGRVTTLIRTQLQSVSCDLLANPEEIDDATSLQVDVSNDAACMAVRSKCPNVDLGFSSDEDEDSDADG